MSIRDSLQFTVFAIPKLKIMQSKIEKNFLQVRIRVSGYAVCDMAMVFEKVLRME